MMEVETEMDSGETRARGKNLNKNNCVEATRDEIGQLEARSRCV
jgi:hypothetical protein